MRVKINKYLKNLGITEDTYWVIADDHGEDTRYEEDEDGIVDAETWNLNTTLAMIIYSYLCYFRDHCLHAYPCGLTFEKWKEYLNKMIKAFELMIVEDDTWNLPISTEEKKQISKNRNKQINFGLRLFTKYFNDLWW